MLQCDTIYKTGAEPFEIWRCSSVKRKVFVVVAVVCIFAAAFFIGTGFQKKTDVILTDYSAAEDGTSIRLVVQGASSMGYVRGFKDAGGGVRPHYLTFYQTFGGLNSSLGAKNTFILAIGPDDTEIFFNRPQGGYECVLQKDGDTGEWIRPTE